MHVDTLQVVYRYYVPADAPDDNGARPRLPWVRGYVESGFFRRPLFVQDAGAVVRGYVQFLRELTPEEVSKYGLLPSLYGWRGYIGDDGAPIMPDRELERLVAKRQLAEDAERFFGTREEQAACNRANRALRDYLTERGASPEELRAFRV